MKKEELMIGDWLSLNYDINYKTGELIYAPVQITGINSDGTIDVNFTYDPSPSMQDGWDPKLFESIPLTAEILEKNGFHDRMPLVDDYYISDGIHYNIYSKYIMFGYVYGNALEVKCEYVHELQHLLKDCKIEKEIIL